MSLLQEVLMKRPVGLVFDIDGTLSPIAPTPDAARLYPGVDVLLKEARQYAHVAIMTGRAINNGAAMVNVEGITYVGTHGMEWSDGLPLEHSIQIVPEALAYIEPSKKLLDMAEQQLTMFPGLLIERKRIGGAIHYRLSPKPDEARQAIITLLKEPAEQMNIRLGEGKRVIEIKPQIATNKGRSLRKFVERYNLQGVLFAGDDRTDLDAVMEIETLKQEGIAGLSIVVQHTDTLPALLEKADIIVQEVEGMVEKLKEIVEILRTP